MSLVPVNPTKLCWQLIECACGCGAIILNYDKWGERHYYKKGHYLNVKNPAKYGSEHPWWKGGRIITPYGYALVYAPDHPHTDSGKYVREHRLVYEKYYNCCLLPWTQVHHINGDKLDNRIENLEPMSNSQHQHRHTAGISKIPKDRKCIMCGGSYRNRWRKFFGEWYCLICGHKIERQLKKKLG